MALTASGIGSGLDINSLVSQLVAAEGQPATLRLNTKEANLQADLSAFGSLKSALSSFQTNVNKLTNLSAFQTRTAVSSNEDLFLASARSTAVAGSYDIEVVQLAEAAKIRSGDGLFTEATDAVGTGTLDISLGADTFQVTVDAESNSLEGVRDAINAASDNPGITASIINVDGGAHLILTSDKIGQDNAITLVATDADGGDGEDLGRLATANFTSLRAAQDAIIKVDGQAATRGTNVFSDVIEGVTFTLKSAEPDTIETLTIALDKSGVKTKVSDFVKAYNSLADTLAGLSSFNASTGAAGPLLGDSVLRGVQSQIRQQFSESVSGGNFGTLAELGITTDEKGHLNIDNAELDDALNADFESVSQLFASENGLAKSLSTVLERYLDTDGILTSRTAGLQSRIEDISGDRESLNRRLASVEARYLSQFSAMDVLVGQLQSLGSYLSSQLASLPEPNSIRRR